MQNTKSSYSILFQNDPKPKPKPRVAMLFVYIVVGLSLCVFGASIWFSSYAKGVYVRRRPIFEHKQEKIQNEINNLIIQENTLTDVEKIRSLIKELGLVEYIGESIRLNDR